MNVIPNSSFALFLHQIEPGGWNLNYQKLTTSKQKEN